MRTSWEQTRWQTFWLLHNGMLDTKKAGINSVTDLIRFPWDDETPEADDLPSDDEINAMRAKLKAMNNNEVL